MRKNPQININVGAIAKTFPRLQKLQRLQKLKILVMGGLIVAIIPKGMAAAIALNHHTVASSTTSLNDSREQNLIDSIHNFIDARSHQNLNYLSLELFSKQLSSKYLNSKLLASTLTTGASEPKLLYKMKGHLGTIKSLGFSPDGKTLVSGGGNNDGMIRLWNPSKGKMRGLINRAHKTSVHSVLISPNGAILASGSNDNTLNLWNLQKNRFSRTFISHTGAILALGVTPDSKMLISAATDGIRVWDLLQERPLGALVQFDNSIHAIAVSPNGQLVASGDNKGTVKIWDLKQAKVFQASLSAHTQTITGIAFTPDGQNLVTTSRDQNIKIWQLSTGKLLRTITGHDNWVNAIAVHPQGEILASAGRDGIKLWNINTGEAIATVYGHDDWVSAIAFSPDGKYLASGGFDKMICIWEIR